MLTTWTEDYFKKVTKEQIKKHEEELVKLQKEYDDFIASHPSSDRLTHVIISAEADSRRTALTNMLCNIGVYHEGFGPCGHTEKGYKLAIPYYERAANLKELNALTRLGYLYYLGKGFETNFSTALNMFERASRFGHGYGSFMAAKLYQEKRDYAHALYYFMKATEFGDPKSRYYQTATKMQSTLKTHLAKRKAREMQPRQPAEPKPDEKAGTQLQPPAQTQVPAPAQPQTQAPMQAQNATVVQQAQQAPVLRPIHRTEAANGMSLGPVPSMPTLETRSPANCAPKLNDETFLGTERTPEGILNAYQKGVNGNSILCYIPVDDITTVAANTPQNGKPSSTTKLS